MYKNYLKIAWRNLFKGGFYSVINIFGMGLGIGICILIFLFVKEEWSYDTYHDKSDRIYRAWVKEHFKGDIFFNSITPYLLGTEVRDNFPEVEEMARYTTINSLVKLDNQLDQETVHLVDPSFFRIFDNQLEHGTDFNSAELHSASVTSTMAKKYFGTSDVIGQTLNLQIGGEWTDFKIISVIEDAPSNSSISYDILIPFENTTSYMSEYGRQCWTCVSVETFFLLEEGQDVLVFQSNIASFIDKKVAEDYEPGEYIIGMQALSDIHLNNDIPEGFIQVSDRRYPYILAGIALLILLLACINFTTLSVGRSLARAKEVGIRKVTGATRYQLMFQFWGEAFLTVLGGIIIGLLIAKAGLPFFNQLADKSLVLGTSSGLIMGIVIIFILTGLLSGLYPALVLSGFKPITTLSGNPGTKKTTKGSVLGGLVAFQFALSLILIICTGIMQNQMQFLQSTHLGFDKSQVLTVPYNVSGQNLSEMWEDAEKVLLRIEDELAGNTSILGITSSSHTFGRLGWMNLGYTDKEENRFKHFTGLQADEDFLGLMDIPVKEGRNFLKEVATDDKAVIINSAMVREFNLSDPIGNFLPEPFEENRIIGITDDFHYSSLHNPVKPLVISTNILGLVNKAPDLTYIDSPNPKFSFKLRSDNLPGAVKSIESAWNKAAPDQAFDYSFIDDAIDFQYRKEAKLSSILTVATFLALFIACMGLFGISALKIAFKTKEIGIRKVLGASSAGILYWISSDYLRLILVATTVAIPIAWFTMNKWLQDFAFHVEINIWVFLFAAVLTTAIALITVSFQTIRASRANPVNALRDQ